MSGEGTDGIAAMIGNARQQFPGDRFELSAGPDAHHGRVRFAWTLVGADNGTPAASGVDFASVAGDGRLREVTGFLEPLGSAPPDAQPGAGRPVGRRTQAAAVHSGAV